MNKTKENTDMNYDFEKDNVPSIRFKRKKRKSTTILFTKLLTLIIITIAISIVSSMFIFNTKYKYLIDMIDRRIDKYSMSVEYSNEIENVKNSLVTIGASKEDVTKGVYIDGNSTGIIIEGSGKILTNYSVIKDLKEIYVKISGSESEVLKAEIIFDNQDIDIAIIQVNCTEYLTPIKFASSDEITVGQRILLISNSADNQYVDSLIPGILTSTNRPLEVENRSYNLFEVNTPINKFNTGGIVSNLKGELIGVASKKLTDDMNVSGLYYTIDLSSLEKFINYANEIKDILGIIEGGFINDGSGDSYLGLYVARVDQSRDINGLKPTDIIFEIDGQKLNKNSQILEMLKNKKNGDTVTCKVMRSGKVINIDIILDNIKK